MPSQNYVLTPEQLALSQERKRRKAEAASSVKAAPVKPERAKILPRNWLRAAQSNGSPPDSINKSNPSIVVMTFNMLAQCLVRRELFPNSDCLKAQQRQGMLHEEIHRSNADIICLQEVDRLESLLPHLESLDYGHKFSCGPRKKHGCLIAYRSGLYESITDHTVFYDEFEVRDAGEPQYRRASGFRTRNIALIVGLRHIASGQPVIVATTHLFWHPRYTYERLRQIYILTRSIQEFKSKHNFGPCMTIMAGDFNFPPGDAGYSLLVGDALLPEQKTAISVSRVVHLSVDPSAPLVDSNKAADDEEGGDPDPEQDPDRVIVNARPARDEDGLLTPKELEALFSSGTTAGRFFSAYDQWTCGDVKRTFGSRANVETGRKGRYEPIYTSYTFYWQATLDYIFLSTHDGQPPSVQAILEPPSRDDIDPGLPRLNVCGSDHISLVAEVSS